MKRENLKTAATSCITCYESSHHMVESTNLKFSKNLEATLHRSLAYANEANAKYATLEHLLLALTDDNDAIAAFKGCGVRPSDLRSKVASILTLQDFERIEKEDEDSKPTASFQRVIQRAVIHVQSSGRLEVTGANVLVAIFAEHESDAAKILSSFDLTRYDLVNYISHGITRNTENKKETAQTGKNIARIEKSISESAKSAPTFHVARGRIRYEEAKSDQAIRERKQLAMERCADLQKICVIRGNEQPDLVALINKYASALKALRKDRGSYKLLVIGLEIETLLRIKEKSPADPDRNPPLGADFLFAIQSLIIAHAGLVSLYPDAQRSFVELDRYRHQSASIDALRDRVLDPVLSHLAKSKGILDETTQEQTKEIENLNELDQVETLPSKGATSTKHAWLRGALTSMGAYLLEKTQKIIATVRDVTLKEIVSAAAKNPDKLFSAIVVFFGSIKGQLLALSDLLTSGFGWIRSLLGLVGL